MRSCLWCVATVVFLGASVARGWSRPSPLRSCSFSARGGASKWRLGAAAEGEAGDEQNTKFEIAGELRRLFDVHEMAYTVMIREDQKGSGGKLTPEELISAIEQDSMFGEDLEEYRTAYCSEASEGDVTVLAVGKCADDGLSSEPLPDEDGLTIPGKGTYLVHLSFAEDVLATMRVVVD